MDAFEKWWASEVVGKPTECFPTYEETFHAGKAEGIKEGMRRAAEFLMRRMGCGTATEDFG